MRGISVHEIDMAEGPVRNIVNRITGNGARHAIFTMRDGSTFAGEIYGIDHEGALGWVVDVRDTVGDAPETVQVSAIAKVEDAIEFDCPICNKYRAADDDWTEK